MSQPRKLQRWIDLMAALLARRFGMTFDEIRDAVPGYAGDKAESVRRTFERDKDELRAMGVPIETRGTEGNPETRYILAGTQFYLPYLSVVSPRGRAHPKRVDRYGYHSLMSLDLTVDELALLADAAARVRQLGDPALAADIARALAKLAIDIPDDHLAAAPNVAVVAPRNVASSPVFAALTDALLRRKRVAFSYFGIERDETRDRDVEPYGMAFTSGHWYLHARDPGHDDVRRFRLARIRNAVVNPVGPGTPDYVIPRAFRLAVHAHPVPPWELGTDPPVDVVVRYSAANGVTRSARALGASVPGQPDLTRYAVRRRDRFCRWLLGLAGDAVPVSPPAITNEWRDLVERTRLAMTTGSP